MKEGEGIDDKDTYKRLKSWEKPSAIVFDSLKILTISLSSHFHIIIYAFMILAMIWNGDLINLVYPLSIFAYAIYEECWPSSWFWKFLISYSLMAMIVKFIFQIYPISNFIISYNQGSINNFLWSFWIGIMTINNDTQSLTNFFIFDAILILLMIFHMFQLMINGLWDRWETDIETFE